MSTPVNYWGMQVPGIQDGFYPSFDGITSVRLWDNGVTWKDVNPAPHTFDWTKLDAAIAMAEAHGANVFYVLGQTPEWCSSDLSLDSPLGNGAAAYPTDHAYWVEYCQQVATRYAGRIEAYEIWNEPTYPVSGQVAYGSMTPEQMAYLTSLAVRTIKPIDPATQVASPSWIMRGPNSYMNDFIAAGGYGGSVGGVSWQLDATSLHAYPDPGDIPEAAINEVMALKDIIDAATYNVPIWVSEINYNLPYGGTVPFVAQPIDPDLQAAYVSRTYLYGRSKGDNQAAKRMYWYNWSNEPFLGVQATDPNNSALPSIAMLAMLTAKYWLRGTITSLTYNSNNDVYVLKVSYPAGDPWANTPATIKWCPSGTRNPSMPSGATHKYDLYGNEEPLTTEVNPGPKLWR